MFDTFNVVLWDDDEECYVAYVRINQRPRKRFRSLGRIASKDFIHWSVPTIVLQPDGEDPEDADLYTSGAFRYGEADSVYFMMPSIFDWRRGQLWVQLATSRDNVNWRRAGGRAKVSSRWARRGVTRPTRSPWARRPWFAASGFTFIITARISSTGAAWAGTFPRHRESGSPPCAGWFYLHSRR